MIQHVSRLRRSIIITSLAVIASAVTGGNLAQAQSCSATWTGNAGNGLWSTAGNWSPRKVPGPTSDVCIPELTQADATPPISIHSLQITGGGLLIIESGKAGASFTVAKSLVNQGVVELYGASVSAGSIVMTDPANEGSILAYSSSVPNNSSITSPAFSNTTGTVYVGVGVTLQLAENPVQLQNGTLSGGNWDVDDTGTLIVASDISQITTEPGAAYYTTVSISGRGSLLDTSGNSALTTLTSVGSHGVLTVNSSAALIVDQNLTSEGVVNVGTGSAGSLTVKGTYTQASGAATNMATGTLSATSVIVQSGSTLQGTGTIASSITNDGTVAPRGPLTVTGNYSQAAVAALTESFGSTLNVTSNATLSGTLNVTVSPKHPPKSGAQYNALTFGSLRGSFTSHTAGFTLTSNANSIVVTKQ
jgi:hypothetical protein